MSYSTNRATSADFPCLARSYKNCFAFRLATTSFVYPADYTVNVQLLAPYLDEIELLLFESEPQPPLDYAETIAALYPIVAATPVGFNVHLPLDIALGAADPVIRQRSVTGVCRVLDCARVLQPSTFTLHLDYGLTDSPRTRRTWHKRLEASLREILKSGIAPRSISIENLDYPLEWVQPLIQEFDLSVCLDVGHLLRYGYHLENAFARFADRITIMHLHGVDAHGRDHIGLNNLSTYQLACIRALLHQFRGVVSLEVFNFKHLEASLSLLSAHLPHSGGVLLSGE